MVSSELRMRATVVAHFYAFCVHLVIMCRLCPVKASVAFLADKKVREIHFFKLELDWLDKFGSDQFCGLRT
jgi:hypothetical protein